jgi:hypothetical protein
MRAMLKGNNQNAKGKNKLYLGVLIFGEEVDILVFSAVSGCVAVNDYVLGAGKNEGSKFNAAGVRRGNNRCRFGNYYRKCASDHHET